ncbi:hypothetical protein GOODEAATRI_004198 [Goodea atripinnis]|uniref:Uncharacterized protein n=1 Tax=Goodea atripinnis TaxID=208336 RepID=A0ABV0PL81_9TELE
MELDGMDEKDVAKGRGTTKAKTMADDKKKDEVPELQDKVTPLSPLTTKPALSNEDIMRYSRQLLLPELGVKGTHTDRQGGSDRLNSTVECIPYHLQLSPENALQLIQQQCSHPISGKRRLRAERQTFGVGECFANGGAVPPAPETVTNCSDGGVLGVASCGQQLLMFDAQGFRFRSIRLRPKQADCAVCGESPRVTQLIDYEAFCGSAATDKVGH